MDLRRGLSWAADKGVPSIYKTLVSSLSIEEGRKTLSHLQIPHKLEASLSFMRPVQKRNKVGKEKGAGNRVNTCVRSWLGVAFGEVPRYCGLLHLLSHRTGQWLAGSSPLAYSMTKTEALSDLR